MGHGEVSRVPPNPFFQQVIPGLFFFVGVTPDGIDPATAYSNRSPKFFADERGLLVGVRALAHPACDFLESNVTAGSGAPALVR